MRGERTYLSVAPPTVQSCQTVVTFDCFVTPVALPGHVAFHLNLICENQTEPDRGLTQ